MDTDNIPLTPGVNVETDMLDDLEALVSNLERLWQEEGLLPDCRLTDKLDD